MSRLFVRADSDELTVDAAPLTAMPLTLACWFRSDSLTVSQKLVWIGDKDVENNWFSIEAHGSGTGDPIQAQSRDGSTKFAVTSTGYSANTWHHACGVFTSSTSRTVFIDGGSSGSDTTSSTPAGLDRVRIGGTGDSTPGRFMSGRIAEAAIWNVALSGDEIVSLAGGILPLMVRSGGLVGYWPIWGVDSPEPDYSGTNNLTVTGAPVVSDHSPTALMLPPPTGWEGAFTATVAAGFTPRSYPRGANRGILRGVA